MYKGKNMSNYQKSCPFVISVGENIDIRSWCELFSNFWDDFVVLDPQAFVDNYHDLSNTYKEKISLIIKFCMFFWRKFVKVHSALKLEKSSISKVQKHIICNFKNGKKSIFAPEKSPKIAFLVVLNFFLVQKLIFCHFWKCK